jgi:ATP-dependent Clp protease ATP-binding subunit ClpA
VPGMADVTPPPPDRNGTWHRVAGMGRRLGPSCRCHKQAPEDRKIPYSPRAKNALVGAREEMRRLGDGHLGTEHVLLGILRNADGVAVRMLRRMGGWPEALDDRLCELRGRAGV